MQANYKKIMKKFQDNEIKVFSFRKKGVIQFPYLFERLDRFPYAIKYYNGERFLPAIIFKIRDKVLVVLFKYSRKRKVNVREFHADKMIVFWKEKKIRYFTPLLDFMTDAEKIELMQIVLDAKHKKDVSEVKRKARKFFIRLGNRLNLDYCN